MYRKTIGNKRPTDHPKGNEKQLDCNITKRRHLKFYEDAEANDMIPTCAVTTDVSLPRRRMATSKINLRRTKIETTKRDRRRQN